MPNFSTYAPDHFLGQGQVSPQDEVVRNRIAITLYGGDTGEEECVRSASRVVVADRCV